MSITATTDPGQFDTEGFLSGFRPATMKVKVHYRGDLIPRLTELLGLIRGLQDGDAPAEAREGSWAEGDQLTSLVAEFNELQKQFEAGGFTEFEFAPRSRKRMRAAEAEFKRSPYVKLPTKDERTYWAGLFQMVAHCISPEGITPEAFDEMQEIVGDVAMTPLSTAFVAAFQGGGEPDVPFSPLPSPTPPPQEPSAS